MTTDYDKIGPGQLPPTEKAIKPVVKGQTSLKKKSSGAKLAEAFIAEDAKNVGSYIVKDVLIPTIKDTIFDVVSNSLSMAMFGDVRRSTSHTYRQGMSPKISYGSFYNDRRESPSRQEPKPRPRSSGAFDYNNVVFNVKEDAKAVLSEMDNVCEVYGFVSVSDLYDIANITDNNYLSNKYGWRAHDLQDAHIISVRDGYVINLPKPSPLE